MCENLLELNPDVQGDFIDSNVTAFVSDPANEEKIRAYRQIIATDIDDVTI